MRSPTLDPYREEILSLLCQGKSFAEVWRYVERQHGVKISRSQFSAFARQLKHDAPPESKEEEMIMPVKEVKTSEAATADAFAEAILTGLPRVLDEFSQRLSALEQLSKEHDQKTLSGLRHFSEALAGVTGQMTALQARPDMPSSPDTQTAPETAPGPDKTVATDTLRSIWKRAFIVSGVFWGALELLVIQGYWRPLWEILSPWIGFGEIVRL